MRRVRVALGHPNNALTGKCVYLRHRNTS